MLIVSRKPNKMLIGIPKYKLMFPFYKIVNQIKNVIRIL